MTPRLDFGEGLILLWWTGIALCSIYGNEWIRGFSILLLWAFGLAMLLAPMLDLGVFPK